MYIIKTFKMRIEQEMSTQGVKIARQWKFTHNLDNCFPNLQLPNFSFSQVFFPNFFSFEVVFLLAWHCVG